MDIEKLTAFLESCIRWRRHVLVVGDSGIGKTFSAREAARRALADYFELSAPIETPVRFAGYPRPPLTPDGDATHALFGCIAKCMRATKLTVLNIDDLGMASDETKRAALRLVQFGEIDGRKFPECVVLMAMSNDVGQGADVYGMLEPMKTRWHTIIPVETSVEAVVPYGLSRNWPSDMCAFLRNNPEALIEKGEGKHTKSMTVSRPCPRGWENAAEWINLGCDDPEVIAGCVGKGRASEYLAYRQLVNELPDVDAVLMSPDTAPVPDNPSARYLVSLALASRMTAKNFERCLIYLRRLPQMFRAYSIRDAIAAEDRRRQSGTAKPDHKPIATSREFNAWAVMEDGKAILSAVRG